MTSASNARVHLAQRWERMGWDVFVYRHRPGTTELASVDEQGDLQFDRSYPEGRARIDEAPTFFLREDELRALVDAAVEKLPADGSMAAHLKDAQTIRDRLLTMIEARGIR